MLKQVNLNESNLLQNFRDILQKPGKFAQLERLHESDSFVTVNVNPTQIANGEAPLSIESTVFEPNNNFGGNGAFAFHASQVSQAATRIVSPLWADTFASQSKVEEPGIYPRIVINDTIGESGSRAFASPFNAVVSLALGCTGTLIAANVVIAARHCGASSGDQINFGEDSNNGVYTATVSTAILPAGNGSLLDGGDVSILILTADVPASVADPMRLIDETESLEGKEAALIGYGFNGLGSQGHEFTSDDMRWGGLNIIDSYGEPDAATGQNIFSTDFDDGSSAANTIVGSDPTPLEFEATTAPGDSGGPLLVNVDDEWVVAGVLSGGTSPTSVYGDISWWTGVAPFRAEIENAGGVFVGSTPTEDEHSDLVDATATLITFDAIPIARGEGIINTLGDRDVFRFDLLNPAKVIFDGVSIGGFDTYLRVYDSEATLIGENNDKPGSISSQFNLELETGEYFVSVGSNNDSTTGKYRVAVRHNGPRDDNGQRFSNATRVTMNTEGKTVITAVAENGNDIDMFRFIADRTGELVLRTKSLSGDLNTVLRVWDENRSMIGVNNNWNGQLNSRIAIQIEEGKTYYTHIDTISQTKGDYRLFLLPQSEGGGGKGRNQVDLTLPSIAGQASSAIENRFGMAAQAELGSSRPNGEFFMAAAGVHRADLFGSAGMNLFAPGQ